MYVCKSCHDIDNNAIGCKHSAADHLNKGGAIKSQCEICGTYAYLVFCSEYSSITKPNDIKSCEVCAYRTQCTKYYMAIGTYEQKAKGCMTFIPEGKVREIEHGKYNNV